MTPDTPADGALAEAIADLKSCADPGDWTANDFYPVITRGRGASIATVLNAVLSGALTPRPAPEGIKPDGALHPERIWVSAPNDDNEVSCWDDPDEGGTEYVRADLIPRPAEPAQAAQADWEARRWAVAVGALGAMPEGYCFCSTDRIGDDSKTHEPECADLRALMKRYEDDRI